MKTTQAYVEEYFERIAIKMENDLPELLAQAQSRSEVLAYAKKDGADIREISKLIAQQS
tara:strand:- start:50436 stop:50612 length:177 start_codon:yes stop_codon:yes gene_type:complete